VKVVGLALLIGTGLNWLLRRRGEPLKANLAITAMMIFVLFCVHWGYAIFSPEPTSKAMALEIKRYVAPEDKIVVNGKCEIGSTLNYYTGRELYVLNGHDGNLWFSSSFPGAPNIFLDDQIICAPVERPESRVSLPRGLRQRGSSAEPGPQHRICVCSRRREDRLYESPARSVSLSFRADRTTNRGPSYVLMSRVRYNQYWRKRDASMA
jgi:hypothetical protein